MRADATVSELPAGTITFLFTDVEGSTRLLHEHGAGYVALLADHRRALRDVFARHQGIEVDTQGDSFFVAFARATDAVAAAGVAQEALGDGPVQVRIGIHTGEPRDIGSAREELGANGDAAWEEGRQLSFDAAVELALQVEWC